MRTNQSSCQRRQKNNQRTGGGLGRFLLWMVLISLVGGGGFYLWAQQKAMKEVQLAKEARSAQALKVMMMLTSEKQDEVKQSLMSGDFVAAKKGLVELSNLDSNGQIRDAISRLEAELRGAVRQREIDKAIAVARPAVDAALKENDVKLALSLLHSLSESVPSGDVRFQSLKTEIDKKSKMLKSKSNLEQAFANHLDKYEIKGAATKLALLLELSGISDVENERWRAMYSERVKSDSSVREALAKLRAEDSKAYSVKLLKACQELPQAHPAVKEYLVELEARPQVIRVPSDLTTLDEAVAALKPGGTIELGIGVFYAEVVFDKSVILKGSGRGKTFIESRCLSGPCLEFDHVAGNSSISHLSIRGFSAENGKHALVLLKNGKLEILHCSVSRSGGHGVAVITGELTLKESDSSANEWDGLAAVGKNSVGIASKSSFSRNGGHGVDVWAGAKGTFSDVVVEANSQSGLTVIGAGTGVTTKSLLAIQNREAGIYVSQTCSLTLNAAISSGNVLSGIVIQGGARVSQTGLQLTGNGEYGWVIDHISVLDDAESVRSVKNTKGKMLQKSLRQ